MKLRKECEQKLIKRFFPEKRKDENTNCLITININYYLIINNSLIIINYYLRKPSTSISLIMSWSSFSVGF